MRALRLKFGNGAWAAAGGHIDITLRVYAQQPRAAAVRLRPHNLRYVQVATWFLIVASGADSNRGFRERRF
jgi:hypothetical protein